MASFTLTNFIPIGSNGTNLGILSMINLYFKELTAAIMPHSPRISASAKIVRTPSLSHGRGSSLIRKLHELGIARFNHVDISLRAGKWPVYNDVRGTAIAETYCKDKSQRNIGDCHKTFTIAFFGRSVMPKRDFVSARL